MGITPNSPHRSGPGSIGFPVTIAGQPVSSGDVVIADQDGVVIIPKATLPWVIDRLPAIRHAEAQADQSVRDGARLPGFLK
jgi:regulator of RNase E activity RraA